jgi:subtilisin
MKKLVSSVLLVVLLINIVVIGTVAAQPSEKIPVIIKFNGKPDAALIRAFGGEIKHEYSIIPAIACSIPEQAIDALQRNPKIEKIEPDGIFYALTETLDWGVDRIDAEVVHASNNKGTGVKVAVIDTGIYYTHPDLGANYIGGYDFVNNDADPMDDNGHGTHCAGIIAAVDNEIGVIGVAPEADLYALKVLDSTGSGSESNVIAAIQWAVSNGIQVVSMSLGSDGASSSLELACYNAEAAGVLLVAAAGNDYRVIGRREWDTVDYPARYSSVIAVGATDSSDLKADFSSTGSTVEIAAPGVDILSTFPPTVPIQGTTGHYYAYGSGTSMATPHVAGVAALIFASGVETASEVRTILQTTADDLGTTGRDYWYGYGLVDADEAAPGTIIDTIGPTINELNPADGTLTKIAAQIISAKVQDPSGIDEDSIIMTVDSVVVTHTFDVIMVSFEESALSDGLHSVTLSVSDSLGNIATEAWVFEVDTSSPDQVNGLGVTPVSSSQLDLIWDPIVDAVEYKIYRDTERIAITTTTSYSDTNLAPSTTYTYSVSAIDLAGNEGPLSAPKSATTSEAPATTEMVAEILGITTDSRKTGRNTFYWATATVEVTYSEGIALEGATVYGHWEIATTDTEIGTTDNMGIVVFTSNSVKNQPTATFTFVIDDVVLAGYDYNP